MSVSVEAYRISIGERIVTA